MQKNYYVILGVTTGASADDIKAAFRRRARELHPDTSGLESGPFLEVQEAYGVLSDPARRREYDHQTFPGARRRPWGPAAEPLRPPRPDPEPFRAVTPVAGFYDIDFNPEYTGFQPSFEEIFDRLWSNFESLERPKSENLESLTVEALIDHRDARFGGRLRVRIPARATCPSCGGSGAVGPYACWRCEGHGALAAEYPVEIPYPPGMHDGYAVRIPLDRYGIQNFYLTVLFRISQEQ